MFHSYFTTKLTQGLEVLAVSGIVAGAGTVFHFLPDYITYNLIRNKLHDSVNALNPMNLFKDNRSKKIQKNNPFYNLVSRIRKLERKEIGRDNLKKINQEVSEQCNNAETNHIKLGNILHENEFSNANKNLFGQDITTEWEKIKSPLLGRMKASSVTKGDNTIYTARLKKGIKSDDIILSIALPRNETLTENHLKDASVFCKKDKDIYSFVSRPNLQSKVKEISTSNKKMSLSELMDPKLSMSLTQKALTSEKGVRAAVLENLKKSTTQDIIKYNNRGGFENNTLLQDNVFKECMNQETMRRGNLSSFTRDEAKNNFAAPLIDKLFDNGISDIIYSNHSQEATVHVLQGGEKKYLIHNHDVFQIVSNLDNEFHKIIPPINILNPLNFFTSLKDYFLPEVKKEKEFFAVKLPINGETGESVPLKFNQDHDIVGAMDKLWEDDVSPKQHMQAPADTNLQVTSFKFLSSLQAGIDIYDIANHFSSTQDTKKLHNKVFIRQKDKKIIDKENAFIDNEMLDRCKLLSKKYEVPLSQGASSSAAPLQRAASLPEPSSSAAPLQGASSSAAPLEGASSSALPLSTVAQPVVSPRGARRTPSRIEKSNKIEVMKRLGHNHLTALYM